MSRPIERGGPWTFGFEGLRPPAPAPELPPHGTSARYQAGCDCPLCLDAIAAEQRARRGGDPTTLRVECECGRTVMVPADDVRHGRFDGCSQCRKRAA